MLCFDGGSLEDCSHSEGSRLEHGLLGGAGIGSHCAQVALLVILCLHLLYGLACGLAEGLQGSSMLLHDPKTYCIDLPVAWLRACKGRHCHCIAKTHCVDLQQARPAECPLPTRADTVTAEAARHAELP